MKKNLLLSLLFIGSFLTATAQTINVYPTNWWVGMKNNTVQLLIHSTDTAFSSDKVTIQHPGITILKTHQFSNKKYLAIDIAIAPETVPGEIIIELAQSGKSKKIK